MECNQSGVCCRLFLINLNEQEYLSEEFDTELQEFGLLSFNEAQESGSHFLKQQKDGSCIYLKDNKCSVHSKRPEACREFFCESTEERFKGMVEEVKLVKLRNI
tara:strand:+ start:2235 stop:2546 length:312 start_codon:yes stop_codon:yes gene_type:complete